MKKMEKRDSLVLLYDFYGELLTEKQREYFEYYYFQNWSLGEISDQLGVSRNAVHKVIQGVEEKLVFYEEKLQLFYKNREICDIIKIESNPKIKERLERLV